LSRLQFAFGELTTQLSPLFAPARRCAAQTAGGSLLFTDELQDGQVAVVADTALREADDSRVAAGAVLVARGDLGEESMNNGCGHEGDLLFVVAARNLSGADTTAAAGLQDAAPLGVGHLIVLVLLIGRNDGAVL